MATRFTKYTLTSSQPVTTTHTVSSSSSIPIVSVGYLKSLHFIFRMLIIGFLLGALIALNWRNSYYNWHAFDRIRYFQMISVIAIVVSVTFIIFYFFNLIRRMRTVPWTLIEAVIGTVFAILLIIASVLLVSWASDYRYYQVDNFYVAGAFGFAAAIIFIVEAIMNFDRYRRGIYSVTTDVTTHRQGALSTTTTTTTAVVVH